MKRLAIITARGGSKRIPRKNIKDFCGKPIIAYSIEAAMEAGIFDTVMVSTEDEEIAEIARRLGAEVPFLRSAETSGDFASTADVVAEVLAEYESRGEHFDAFCCIYPTAPFLTGARLSEAAVLLEEQDADGVVPVVRFGFPPQRCVVMKEGFLEFKWPENRLARSQDLEPFYHDAGQFYFLKTESFEEQRQMFPAKTVPLVLEELEVQDIDNEVDWKMAEVKFRILQEKKEA